MSSENIDDLSQGESFKKPADLLKLPNEERIEANHTPPKLDTLLKAANIPEPLTQSLPPEDQYFLEVMKNGNIISRMSIQKTRILFGRARECDIQMEHPSLSRFHAAILWKDFANDPTKGFFYVMDLNSTHGTMVNKEKVNPGTCIKLEANNTIIKLGGSSRLLMLTSDQFDEEEDGQISSRVDIESKEQQENECSWGFSMTEDVNEKEDVDRSSLHAKLIKASALDSTIQTNNHQAYSENAQKTLQHWYEREGHDFQYDVNFTNNKFVCTINIPTEAQDVIVTGEPQVRKREAIANTCLVACRLLDCAEELFPWQQSNKKRKLHNNSDDEDDMIDETDEARKKRERRALIQSKLDKNKKVETEESLKAKCDELKAELITLKAKLAEISIKPAKSQPVTDLDDDDALDSFMSTMSEQLTSKIDMTTKIEITKLRKNIAEHEKLLKNAEKLLELSKPSFKTPELTKKSNIGGDNTSTAVVSSQDTDLSYSLKYSKAEPMSVKPASDLKINIKLVKKPRVFEEDEESPKPKMPLRLNLGVGSIVKREQVKRKMEINKKYEESEEDFVDCVLPKSKTGDGSTSLGQKLGY